MKDIEALLDLPYTPFCGYYAQLGGLLCFVFCGQMLLVFTATFLMLLLGRAVKNTVRRAGYLFWVRSDQRTLRTIGSFWLYFYTFTLLTAG